VIVTYRYTWSRPVAYGRGAEAAVTAAVILGSLNKFGESATRRDAQSGSLLTVTRDHE